MYGIPARCKPLSAAEEQVLLAVWETPAPITRRAVARQLAGRGWASGTVLTFLTRLEAKGWLTAAKEANHNVYTPAVTRRAYGVAVMRHRLDTLFGGDLAAAVRALVSECGATPGQLAGAGQRMRGHPRPAGAGGGRHRGQAGRGGGVRQLRRVFLKERAPGPLRDGRLLENVNQ